MSEYREGRTPMIVPCAEARPADVFSMILVLFIVAACAIAAMQPCGCLSEDAYKGEP
jgi:hypothetical protein